MGGSSEGSPLRGTYFRMTTSDRGSGVFDDSDKDAGEEEYGIYRGPDTGLWYIPVLLLIRTLRLTVKQHRHAYFRLMRLIVSVNPMQHFWHVYS